MKQETKMPDGSLLVEHYKTTRRGTQYLASDILVSPDETKTLKHYYDVRGNLKREVIQADGIVTECKYDERGHRISRHTRTSDGARRKALATKEAGGIAAKAPAVITNA